MLLLVLEFLRVIRTMSQRSKRLAAGGSDGLARCVSSIQPDDKPCRPKVSSRNRWLTLPLCLLLALAVGAVFGQTLHGFVNYDDDVYVYENPNITQGLTCIGLAGYSRTDGPAEWLPVTALSRMLDWQLYGAQAGGHHLTNVLLHAANAILLFLLLRNDDRGALAQRLRGGGVCHPSFARGIGGVGHRTQGRAQRTVFHAHAPLLCQSRDE